MQKLIAVQSNLGKCVCGETEGKLKEEESTGCDANPTVERVHVGNVPLIVVVDNRVQSYDDQNETRHVQNGVSHFNNQLIHLEQENIVTS